MSFDLTNKNIKDTFQNLLQKTGSEGKLFDLVGNEITDLTIGGTLTAHSYITSESIVNTSSGSTAFGNSSDDTHKFIGNITASGNISASGTLFSSNLRGVSNALNLYPATSTDAGRIQLAQSDTTFYQTIRPGLDNTHRLGISTLRWSELNVNHITASGNISASGTGSFSEGRFSGFVGIGNGASALNPEALLHLQNTQDDKYLQRWTLNNIEGGIFGDASGDVLKIQVNSNDDLAFTTNATERVRIAKDGGTSFTSHITASGNISASGAGFFGDDSEIKKSNNGGDVSFTIRNSAVAGSTDETVSLKFGHIAAAGGGKIVSGRDSTYTIGAASDSNLQIYTTLNGSDTEKMRIDSDGNVGIGTTTPTKKLEVEGDISASGDVFAHSGSFNYITASIIDVDGDTIRMGGEPFTRANILTLKQGRSLKPLRAGKSKPDFEAEDGTFDGNVVASGNVSASGTVFGNDIKVGATSVVKSVTQIADSVAQQGKITFVNAAGFSVTKRISNLRSTASPTFNNITASGDIFNTHVVQMTNSSSVVDTFNTSSHQTCKYLLQVTSASVIQSSEMLVIQKDSNALNTEFAQINSGINLVNFSTIVNNSNVELIGSSSFISCSVKFNRVLI